MDKLFLLGNELHKEFCIILFILLQMLMWSCIFSGNKIFLHAVQLQKHISECSFLSVNWLRFLSDKNSNRNYFTFLIRDIYFLSNCFFCEDLSCLIQAWTSSGARGQQTKNIAFLHAFTMHAHASQVLAVVKYPCCCSASYIKSFNII